MTPRATSWSVVGAPDGKTSTNSLRSTPVQKSGSGSRFMNWIGFQPRLGITCSLDLKTSLGPMLTCHPQKFECNMQSSLSVSAMPTLTTMLEVSTVPVRSARLILVAGTDMPCMAWVNRRQHSSSSRWKRPCVPSELLRCDRRH